MIQFASVPRLTAIPARASTCSIRYSGVPSTYLPVVTRRNHRRARAATRQRLHGHRRDYDRRAFGVALAVAARVFEAHMLQHQRLDLDVQLLARLFAHAVQRVLAARTDLLLIGQSVLDAPARQLGRQRLASPLTAIGLINLR